MRALRKSGHESGILAWSAQRDAVLLAACCLTGAIVVVDRLLFPDISLGLLHVFPIVLACGFLSRRQILLYAAVAAALCEQFHAGAWQIDVALGLAVTGLVFAGTGLLVSEAIRARQQAARGERAAQLERQRCRVAEEELANLLESSPAAILTADTDGLILRANNAARQLLQARSRDITGEPITRYLPFLANCLKPAWGIPIRTVVEGTAQDYLGDSLFVQLWLSQYQSGSESRLAVIFCDVSEQRRDSEELGLQQLLTSSRIVANAVLHEVRNLCAAASVLHSNLSQVPGVTDSDEYKALGTLVRGVTELAPNVAVDGALPNASEVNAASVLQDLHTILGPSLRESGTALVCEIAVGLPWVLAERVALLQVLLNLAHNSQRAIASCPRPRIQITAQEEAGMVVIRLLDNGPGVSMPERLFQPLQPGADANGLGLYISRALLRTFGGELRYEDRPQGSCFVVELVPAAISESRQSHRATYA